MLSNLSSPVVYTISILLQISNFLSLFPRLFGIVWRTTTMIHIFFVFLTMFNYLERSMYSSRFLLSYYCDNVRTLKFLSWHIDSISLTTRCIERVLRLPPKKSIICTPLSGENGIIPFMKILGNTFSEGKKEKTELGSTWDQVLDKFFLTGHTRQKKTDTKWDTQQRERDILYIYIYNLKSISLTASTHMYWVCVYDH